MESQDEKICHQCPCSGIRTECTEFQKIVDLSDTGVVIYRHSARVDEAIYLTSDFEIDMANNDVFIIHNTKDAEVTSADIVPALVQNKVDCPRCQHIMDHAQRLLQNVSIVDKQDVIGICDHCKMKGKYRPCVDCTKIVKKFMISVHIRGDYEDTKERLKTWLKKIQTMLKGVSSDEKGLKVKSRSQTDLRFDKLREYSERAVHVPDLKQMFKPDKYRPASGKVAPGSKSVYFKDRDETSLIDTESAMVERADSENFVPAEKATVDKDDVPKTKELALSSDQQIILYQKKSDAIAQAEEATVDKGHVPKTKELAISSDQQIIHHHQKKSDTIALGPKTRHVNEIKTISSSTVTKARFPKDLGAGLSKINAIKSETSKSRQTLKGALKKAKPSESRLRARKYHSEDDLTTNIADLRIRDSKISKKGFKYFFPKEAKAKPPKSDLTSSVLIKDTKDRLKDQTEKKKAEARKRKAEENEKKTAAKDEKRAKMGEQRAKLVEASDPDGKKLKADGKEKNSKQPEVGREAEDGRKAEDSLPLQSTGKLKPKSQADRESLTDKLLKELVSKVPKTEKVDGIETSTLKKHKSPDKSSGDKQHAIPKDATWSKKQDAPLKDKDSKIKEKSEQKVGKSDKLSKAKDAKQQQKTEIDLLKKALQSQQIRTQETKQTPQEEKELKETESKIKREKVNAPKDLKGKQEESKKGKKDKGTSDKDKSKEDNEQAKEKDRELKMKKKGKKDKGTSDKVKSKEDSEQAKEKDRELKMKKAQEEDEKKARDLATKKPEEGAHTLDMTYVPPTSELRTQSEESALNRTVQKMKDLDMKDVTIRKPSYDDLILRLVKLKKAASEARKKRASGQPVPLPDMFSQANTVKHKSHLRKVSTCEFCLDSDLELDLDSYFRRREIEEQAGFAEMILGDKIINKTHKPPMKKEENIEPVLFMSAFDESLDKMRPRTVPKVVFEEEPSPNATAVKGRAAAGDQESSKGVIRYALSDRTFIEKGWTLLPTEKVVRKMNVYRMRPAHPEFDWFERNKNKQLIPYETGEKFAEFDDNGRGRLFYKNGRLALDYYDAEETNAQQRFVIYSSGEPDERGRSRPVTVLATFDYLGNGVVFDHGGKIRLKYNQTEGVVLDRGLGPVSHWKWHTLNDPPVLQQVMIDTQMAQKDPDILKLGGPAEDKTRPDNEDMLAIEFDNFIKEKSKKSSQKFKPFQIKMKALKINEQFSLRVLDQATVYLIFREASANLKLNIGMLLDHQEIVDTDTAEVGEVSSNVERFPARSDSLAALQNSVTFAQRYERMRTERECRLRPPEPSASVDQLTAGTSRPLRPPLLTAPEASSNTSPDCPCKSRKPSLNNLYYDTRLI